MDVANSLPKFRAGQIFDWLYVKRVNQFEDMTNLPKELQQRLADSFEFVTLNEITRFESSMAQ